MKDIPGFEGLYSVTENGRVWSHKRLKWIKGNMRSGYLLYQLWSKNKCKYHLAHRLVAQTFIPNPDNFPQVNHLNGNKNDNSVENLEWCSAQQNTTHSREILGNKNAFCKGSAHYKAKLTEKDVKEIRALYSNGNFTHQKLAIRYGITKNTVGFVLSGKTWGWLV